jgi:hypothetical protein
MVHFTSSRIYLALALLFLSLPVAARQDEKKSPQDEKKAAADEKKANEEAGKKAADEFDKKIKELKTVPEKALAILSYGDVEPKDKTMVPPLVRFLNPAPSDLNFVLVTSAAEALGHFRSIPQAAAVLMGALPGYKKNPYVASKISMAIGRIGHESSLTMFDDQLKGTDAEVAVGAIHAIAEFPGQIAVEALFKENARIEVERKKQGLKPELKTVYDKVQPEILKAVKSITGQPWPTIAELTIWWNKHSAQFKEDAAKKEKERKPEAPAARTSIPPVLLVELLFKENAGTAPANSGASASGFPTATMTPMKPAWTTTCAPNGGPAAVDFGKLDGAYAVDLGGGPGIENLKNLKSFTITGWTICWEVKEGPSDKMAGGGNRILSWFNSMKVNEGVELVYRTDGSLQLGIGQWADSSGSARSKPDMIPVYDAKTTNAGSEAYAKWRFFAVTYDSGLASNHVKFYCAAQNADPKLINACDYNRGPSGAKISPTLSIGNLPPMVRPMAPERSYRGILDEIRIYGSTLDGSGALPLEELIRIMNRPKTGA